MALWAWQAGKITVMICPDREIAGQLTDDSFALMDGDKMAGIAYVY